MGHGEAPQKCHDCPSEGECAPMPPRTQSRSSETNVGALLGEHLRRARVASGHRSQDALASTLGTDRSVVTKSETGERPPNVGVLTAWLDACEITGQLRGVLEGLSQRSQERRVGREW